MAGRSEVMVSKALYQIGVLTLLASIFWVGMGIYQVTKAEPNIGVEKELLEPITPTIEMGVIDQWSSKALQLPPVSVTIEQVEEATTSGGGVDELAN